MQAVVTHNPEEVFHQCHPMLLSLATRMLGSSVDAEDIVQDAYLRWRRADRRDVRAPEAFLATIVSRLCLNHVSLAHVRTMHSGEYLDPETLVSEMPSPVEHAELADALSQAFVRMVESLSPTERVVFLLREAFNLDYAEIARVIARSEENCRQILKRARERVAACQVRACPNPGPLERAQRLFLRAARTGEFDELLSLLSADAVLIRDGGDLARPARPSLGGEALRNDLRARLPELRRWTPLLLAGSAAETILWVAAHNARWDCAVLFRIEEEIRTIRVVTCPAVLRQVKALVACAGTHADN